MYIGEINVDREYEFSYPLAPSFFQVMEFLECQDYRTFGIS
jgi:hypothetical protein